MAANLITWWCGTCGYSRICHTYKVGSLYHVTNQIITKYLQALRVQAATPVDEQKLMRYINTQYII